MANKFFETIRNTASRLFGGNKNEQQNNSAGNTASAAPAASPQQPVYKDNTVVKITQPKQSGLYQYSSQNGFKDANEVKQQYSYAMSLGYTKEQALEQMRSGKRWKQVALGENNRPIVSYQGGQYKTEEEIESQYALALRLGLSKKEALAAMQSGTRWKEQAAELWEDEDYKKQTGNQSLLQKAFNFVPGQLAKGFSASDEDAMRATLRQAGYSDKAIEEAIASGQFNPTARWDATQDQNIFGKAVANYNIGDLNQMVDIMRGQAVLNADEALMQRANEISARAAEYMQRNQGAAELDTGWLGNMFAGDFAQYLPQRVYQTAASLPLQATVGNIPKIGTALSQAFGAGSLTYTTTVGSSYNNLIERGVDPVVAANMAKDEAFLSSLVESSDEFFDWAFGVGKGLVSKGSTTAGKKAIKSFGKRFAAGVAKWAHNAHQEGEQEVVQELLTMANEMRYADGYTDGGTGELIAYFLKAAHDKYPELLQALRKEGVTEDIERLWGSYRGGAVIGLIGGGASEIAGGIRSSVDISRANQSLNAFVAGADTESIQALSDDDLSNLRETARYLGRQDALDILENEQNRRNTERQQNTPASTSPVNDENSLFHGLNDEVTDAENTTDFETIRGIVDVDGIQALSEPQLQQYITELQHDIEVYSSSSEDEMLDIAEEFKGRLDEALAEANRRSEATQTEAAPVADTAAQVAESAPVEETPAASSPLSGLTAEQLQNMDKAQIESLETLAIQLNDERAMALLDAERNRRNGVASQPATAYTEGTTPKGEQQNDSTLGDGGQNQSDGRYELGADRTRTDEQEAGPVQEQSESAGNDTESVESRPGEEDSSVGRGDENHKPLRKRLFKRDSESEKVIARREALNRRYRLQDFVNNPERNIKQMENLRKFCVNAIGKALGSNNSRGQRIVNAWLQDTGHAEMYAIWYSDILEGLTDEQKRTFYQAVAAKDILTAMSDGRMDSQTLADILLISKEAADNLLKNAEKLAQDALVKDRIINKDGSVVGVNPFDNDYRQEMAQSGKDNKLVDIASTRKGIDPDARAVTFQEKYKVQPGDKLLSNIPDLKGFKIYKHEDGSYTVTDSRGYIQGDANEDDLSAAVAVARRSSAGYNSATFRMFGGDKTGKNVRFKPGTGELLADERKVFARENMKLQQASAASDELGIKYQNRGKEMYGTTDFFKLDMSIKRGDSVKGIEEGMAWLEALIEGSETVHSDGRPGITMSNGNRYRFFTMTSNGAKKGEAILVNEKYYEGLKKLSLAGLSEEDKLSLNPAKYMTASASVFTPSNANLYTIDENGNKVKMKVKNAMILPDVFVMRPNTLSQFMRIDVANTVEEIMKANPKMSKDEAKAQAMNQLAESLDRDELIKMFSKTMVRELMAQNPKMTEAKAKAQADKVIPKQVDQLIQKNKVGAMLNIMVDMTMKITDGMGFINRPGGMSTQFRGPGGFKGNLLGMDFASYWNTLVPLSENGENQEGFGWYNEDGSVYTGVRHILHDGKDIGVELKDRWGVWRSVNDYDCILFESTCKFGKQFDQFGIDSNGVYNGAKAAEAFYSKAGNYDIRSIPRENVYGKGVASGALEGMTTRGLSQILKNQYGFPEEMVKRVMSGNIDDVINNIAGDRHAMAKLFGYDLGSTKRPSSTDNIAKFLYAWGEEAFDDITVKGWVADKLGQIVTDQLGGKTAFAEGDASYQWIFPDVIGLAKTMTSIHTITNQLSQQVVIQEGTEGGGLTLGENYKPLAVGQVASNRLESASGKNTTVVARSPNTKGMDSQIRQNVHNAIYDKMGAEFGLDNDVMFTAIGDTLTLYLDNDYDGDTVTIFQGPVAQLFRDARREIAKTGKNEKHKVWRIGTDENGNTSIVEDEVTGDLGPVTFTHAKGQVVDNITMESAAITQTVRRYLEAMGKKNVGIFDKMIDRLSVLTDQDLQNALDIGTLGKDYEGMNASQFRALLEARFSVAYVLAIDYAKSGIEYKEFFDLTHQCDQMLTAIAIGNGLIPPDSNSFVPDFYRDSQKASKREEWRKEYLKGDGKRAIVSGNNMLDIIRRRGTLPRKTKNRAGFSTWYETFKDRLGTPADVHLDYTIAMTDPSIRNLPASFTDALDSAYRELFSGGNIRSKDFEDIKKVVFSDIQKRLGLTNEQFTDVILLMLDRNGGNSKLLLNFDQHQLIDPKTTDPFERQCLSQPSTKDIISRNLDLVDDYKAVDQSMKSMEQQIVTMRDAMVKARKTVDDVVAKREGLLNSLEAKPVQDAIAAQDAVSREIQKIEARLEKLKDQNKRHFDREDFEAMQREMELLSDRLSSLKHQMDNPSPIVGVEITEEIQKSLDDMDKAVRNAWRQVSTFAEALDNLYAAYEDELDRYETVEQRRQDAFADVDSIFNYTTEAELMARLNGSGDVENASLAPSEQVSEEQTPTPSAPPTPPAPPAPPTPPTNNINDVPNPAPVPPTAPATVPTTTPTTTTTTEQKTSPSENKQFGERQKAIARKASNLKVFAERYAGTVNGKEDSTTRKRISRGLNNFGRAVVGLSNGTKTAGDVYTAFGALRDTQYYNDDVASYFDDMNDAYTELQRNDNADNQRRYAEAVDHALSKFRARAEHVEKSNRSSEGLTNSAKQNVAKGAARAFSWLNSYQIQAPTFFKALMGFKKGTEGYRMGNRVVSAEHTMQRHVVEGFNRLASARKMKGFDKLASGKTKVPLKSLGGKQISGMEAINLSRMLETVFATQGTVTNVRGINLSDGTKISFSDYDSEGHRIPLAGKVRKELADYYKGRSENKASEVELAYYKAVSDVFEYFSPEVKRVGNSVNGYVDMLSPDWYSPIMWGSGKKTTENFNASEAMLKGSPRYMKSRSETSGGNLYIASMDSVMDTYISRMADYLAYAELREDLGIMNQNSKDRTAKTLGEIAGENMGADYARFANNWVKDMTTTKGQGSDNLVAKMRQAMQKGVLIGSPSVMMKQSASYWNAAGFIDMKYLVAARGLRGIQKNLGTGKSAVLDYRRVTGNIDPTLTEVFSNKASKNPIVNWFKNGINIIDHRTVNNVYIAACMQVEAEGIKRGSAEFDAAVDDLFTQAVMATQPQFATALRAENARSSSEFVRLTSMFRTQQTQNFNRIMTTLGEYQAEKNPETRKALSQTLQGQVASAVSFAVLTAVANALLHKTSKYRDKDDEDEDGNTSEFSAGRIAKRIGLDAFETAAGVYWFGADTAKFLIDQADKLLPEEKRISDTTEFYGVSFGPVTTLLKDLPDAASKMFEAYAKGEKQLDATKKFVTYLTQSVGLPLNNVYNLANAAYMYYLDMSGENPDNFDDVAKYFDEANKAQNQLLAAYGKGDTDKANKLWESLQAKYGDKADSTVASAVKAQYGNDRLTAEQAENLLYLYGGLTKEGAAAKRVAQWDFAEEHPEYKELSDSAVAKWTADVEPAGVDLQIYYNAYTHKAALTKDDTNGNDTAAMVTYVDSLGLSTEKAKALLSSMGYGVGDKSAYHGYVTYIKPAGINAADFGTYWTAMQAFQSDKNSKGKTISGSKQKKIIAYINGLSLSKAQKDALWKSLGYSTKSKVYKKRPWR